MTTPILIPAENLRWASSAPAGSSRSTNTVRLRPLTLVVLTGIVTALAVSADRLIKFDAGEGFTGEWLAMWALAVATSVVFWRTAELAAGLLMRAAKVIESVREEQAFVEALAHDPRMRAELRAARLHAESLSER
jgi:hypothetical protein